jgi:hypothetical protein
MIFLLNQKPDTSLAQKSGHFYLLTTTLNTPHTAKRLATRLNLMVNWRKLGLPRFEDELAEKPVETKNSSSIPLPRCLICGVR